AERAERELRRARKDADKVAFERDKLRLQLKEARKELREAKARIAASERKQAAKKKSPKVAARPEKAATRGPRKPLPVPKGRMEDAPETLREWLGPGVTLIVDGYNVTKAEGGFGTLDLDVQRDRLIDEVGKLVRRKKAAGTIVFDGSEVPPGTSRGRRGAVRVEFSAPDEIADDHIVALIERLPPAPVVLVTNDRELQERARKQGATVATSDQLLGLLR
ncbi:MAG: NYN domain-containing protein, partial [Actinomycetota bacterium]